MLKNLSILSNFGFNEHAKDDTNKNKFLSNNLDKLIPSEIQNELISSHTVYLFADTNKTLNHPNIIKCHYPNNKQYRTGLYLFYDSWSDTTNKVEKTIADTPGPILVDSSFLCALEDPRPLLLAFKRISLAQVSKIILIETDHSSHSATSNQSLIMFLQQSGFNISSIAPQLYEINATSHNYRKYLKELNLDEELIHSHRLYVSTEDASLSKTGGIGTYIKNIKSLNEFSAFLICDLSLNANLTSHRTFVCNSLLQEMNYDSFFDGVGLIEAIRVILYLCPFISTIEFQDYQAIGFRITQARQTGILPANLWLRLFMHGGVDHLKHGLQNHDSLKYSDYEIKMSIKENYIAENVDECFSPSKYLGYDIFQNEFGHTANNLSIHKLPFELSLINTSKIKLTKIKQIAFIGKFSSLKGWPDFIQAMEILGNDSAIKSIEKIIAISPDRPKKEEITSIEKLCSFENLHMSHNELISFIEKIKNYTLFVIPARGENYPFVVLEQLLIGTLFVAYKAGGALEVMDQSNYWTNFFTNPNANALAKHISSLLTKDLDSLSSEINYNSKMSITRQIEINENWKIDATIVNRRSINQFKHTDAIDSVSVVIPIFNTPYEYIIDLIESIKKSILRPKEVIFINDGSGNEYSNELKNIISETVDQRFTYRIVGQENRGLAGARNSGLRESSSDYTFFIDSDDIILPHTLHNAWIAMILDNELVASTGFSIYFKKSSNISRERIYHNLKNGDFWKPLGIPNARAMSLKINEFQPASTMIRTQQLLMCAGWDESDKSTWEDWALYTKLAWMEKKFCLIPWSGYLYRDTPNSMSKTYNQYFGRRRIVRSLGVFSKLDANIIISLINQNNTLLNPYAGNVIQLSRLERKIIQTKRVLFNRLGIAFLSRILKKIIKTN